jgi:hypothetical protein
MMLSRAQLNALIAFTPKTWKDRSPEEWAVTLNVDEDYLKGKILIKVQDVLR